MAFTLTTEDYARLTALFSSVKTGILIGDETAAEITFKASLKAQVSEGLAQTNLLARYTAIQTKAAEFVAQATPAGTTKSSTSASTGPLAATEIVTITLNGVVTTVSHAAVAANLIAGIDQALQDSVYATNNALLTANGQAAQNTIGVTQIL